MSTMAASVELSKHVKKSVRRPFEIARHIIFHGLRPGFQIMAEAAFWCTCRFHGRRPQFWATDLLHPRFEARNSNHDRACILALTPS